MVNVMNLDCWSPKLPRSSHECRLCLQASRYNARVGVDALSMGLIVPLDDGFREWVRDNAIGLLIVIGASTVIALIWSLRDSRSRQTK
jgi:hypothetical protein